MKVRVLLVLCLVLISFPGTSLGSEVQGLQGISLFQQGKGGRKVTLEMCIREALKRSPVLLQARADWSAEKPRRLEVFSGFLPQFSLEYDVTRQATELVPPYYQQYSGWVLTYNLFKGGQTTFSYLATRRDVEVAQAKYRETLIDTVYKVVAAFYDALEKKALWKAAKDDLRDAENNLAMAQAKFREGLAPYADVIKARASVAKARYKLRDRESQYWIALGNLNLEMGRSITAALDLKGELREAYWKVDLKEALQEGLENSPLVREAEKKLEAQKYRKDKVYGEFLPQVDFQWKYGWTDTAFPANDVKQWSWQLTFTIPLFSGFASRARLARARAQVESLEYRLRRVKLEVEQAIWKAYQELVKNEVNVHSARSRLKSASHDLAVTQGRYKEGLATMVDLTTAQAAVAEARAEYISSLAGLHRSMAALEKAMGKIPYLERKRE